MWSENRSSDKLFQQLRQFHECKEFNYSYGEYLQKATQEDFDTIREMVESAVYQYPGNGYSSNPLRIILEEAQMYYAGDATLEETVKKIQSRATLWLNELCYFQILGKSKAVAH